MAETLHETGTQFMGMGALEDALAQRFGSLVRDLVKGNMKRARRSAMRARERMASDGREVVLTRLIEEAAEAHAMRNALIALPSALPGPGTIVAWILMALEDFFTLDRIVTLALTLALLHGHDPLDVQGLESLALKAIGSAYGMGPGYSEDVSSRFAWRFVAGFLPRRYAQKGFNRWVKTLVRRFLGLRRKSRLLPAGIGVAIAAWDAYTVLIAAGTHTVKELSKRGAGEAIQD